MTELTIFYIHIPHERHSGTLTVKFLLDIYNEMPLTSLYQKHTYNDKIQQFQ